MNSTPTIHQILGGSLFALLEKEKARNPSGSFLSRKLLR